MELTRDLFHQAAGLFDDMEHHLSVRGVLTGVLPGRVFLSQDGTSAVLTSPQGIFAGGNPVNTPFFGEANKLLQEQLLPGRAAAGKLDYVLFYPNRLEWQQALEMMMKNLYSMRSGRMTFTHDLSNIEADVPFPEDILSVDLHLLSDDGLAGIDEVRNEILGGWPSLEAFAEKGFGCAAVQNTDKGRAIIGWCLTDWVVGNECELGIETDESFRGQGWARKTALGTLSLAKQRGIARVGWQCWSSNVGSQRTALSVGFRLLADFPVLFGWNLPLNNFLVNGNHYMRGDSKYGVEKDFSRAAWSYAQALDQGWDWHGDAALYWNAACMYYLTGDNDRAKMYYRKAAEKGWKNPQQPHYHEHVYREADSEEIARILARA